MNTGWRRGHRVTALICYSSYSSNSEQWKEVLERKTNISLWHPLMIQFLSLNHMLLLLITRNCFNLSMIQIKQMWVFMQKCYIFSPSLPLFCALICVSPNDHPYAASVSLPNWLRTLKAQCFAGKLPTARTAFLLQLESRKPAHLLKVMMQLVSSFALVNTVLWPPLDRTLASNHTPSPQNSLRQSHHLT